jgi:DNA-binding transcriptional MerR regulator
MARPVQEFFSIGEVCALTDLKPHVLRYWESQFRFLNPAKNRSGNRVYKSRELREAVEEIVAILDGKIPPPKPEAGAE